LVPDDPAALYRWHESIALCGLREADAKGWDRFVVVADSQFLRPGVLVAKLRPQAVEGLALGHASLSRDMAGDRPAANKAIYDAMSQLLAQDHRAFITHGIVQMTQGG